ncbi:hypothetical protein [Vandammella animalimorsus]|uniref:SMODS and SLOG-associating 2TM effector domain-containing protein n=1 Tax=Vandammella animalimorsus TaxID=2029117 RepID=A0A2A2AGR6_9BURK|nr:hypothetical protein [Vandammella animalimorsus]PAT36953.1 hypothetical protein CK625_08660 [Vandammella animalimorsus]
MTEEKPAMPCPPSCPPSAPSAAAEASAQRYQWAVLAAVLRQGRLIDGCSNALAALALLLLAAQATTAWPWPSQPGLWAALGLAVSLLAAWAQKLSAARTAIDAQLLHWLACHASDAQQAASQLDAALQALGLHPGHAAAPPRPWPQRQRACLQLLRRQAGWLLLQGAALALALLAARIT